MDSIDLEHRLRRARFKYEWSRLRRALTGFAPALLVVGVAALLAPHPAAPLGFGALMFGLGVAFLSYGRDVKRAVLPGLFAGIVPLAFTLCARSIDHVCSGSDCMMLCLPACIAGGLIAGLAVAMVGHRGKHRAGFWLSASGLALLTGAMGCMCIGYSGLAGLVLGYASGMVPAAARVVFSRSTT